MAIEGYIDGIRGPFLIGWAHDPARPGDRLELHVELDGKSVGRCVADVGRRDLAQRGIGDGRHGFRLKLPRKLRPGTDHVVVVRAGTDGSILPLASDYFSEASGDNLQRPVTLRVGDGSNGDGAQPAAGRRGRGQAGRGQVGRGGPREARATPTARGPRAEAENRAAAAGAGEVAAQTVPEPEPAAKPQPEPAAKPQPEPAAKPTPAPAAKPTPAPAAKPTPPPAQPRADAAPAEEGGFESVPGGAALAGRSGWLFPYRSAQQFAALLGGRPAPADTIQARVRTLRARHKRLADVGISYLVVTVPSKAAVYPEFLPAGLELALEQRPAERLADLLRDDPRLEAFDLLPALRHARRHGEVYLRQGRELTWTGAFHAYRAVAKELGKVLAGIEPAPVGGLELGDEVDCSDSLRSVERVAAIGDTVVPVRVTEEDPERERELSSAGLDAMYVPLDEEATARLGPDAAALERGAGAELPRAVVFHDGSGARLLPFLAEHFSRTLVEVTERLPVGVVEQEGAAVVIQILSEDGPFFA